MSDGRVTSWVKVPTGDTVVCPSSVGLEKSHSSTVDPGLKPEPETLMPFPGLIVKDDETKPLLEGWGATMAEKPPDDIETKSSPGRISAGCEEPSLLITTAEPLAGAL